MSLLTISGNLTCPYKIHFGIFTGKHNDRLLAAITVMRLAIFRLIHNHRIIKHRTISFRRFLKSLGHGVDQIHMMNTNVASTASLDLPAYFFH